MKSRLLMMTFLLTGSLLMVSCGFVIESVSYKDPEFFDTEYKKLCVSANVDDAFFIKRMEDEVSGVMSSAGIYTTQASNLLPPTRDWDDKKVQQALSDKGFDGYLIISVKDKYIVSNVIPGSKTIEKKGSKEATESKPDESKGGKRVEKGDSLIKKTKETSKEVTIIQETPARIENYDYAFLEAKLIDVRTAKTAWIQNIRAGENRGFQMKDIRSKQFMNDYGKAILKDLAKDRLIRVNLSNK